MLRYLIAHLNIFVFALSLVFIILQISGGYSKNFLYRGLWILLITVVNIFDIYLAERHLAPSAIVFLNQIQHTIILGASIFIILDIKHITGSKNKFLQSLIYMVAVWIPLFWIAPFFEEKSTQIIYPSLTPYYTIFIIVSIMFFVSIIAFSFYSLREKKLSHAKEKDLRLFIIGFIAFAIFSTMTLFAISGQIEHIKISNLNLSGVIFACIGVTMLVTNVLDKHTHLLEEITHRAKAEKELNESLKEKEMLIKEIHHRVKNNLQLVVSLLNLQQKHLSDQTGKAILHDCQNRIKSISFLHEKLYGSKDLGNVTAGDYFGSIVNNIQFSCLSNQKQITIVQRIDNVKIEIEKAISCGLIINELITNSYKHAFNGINIGIIHLLFKFDDKNNVIKIKVSDNGIGFPKNFSETSFNTLGFSLVSSLTSKLKGQMKISRFSPATITIEFPFQPA